MFGENFEIYLPRLDKNALKLSQLVTVAVELKLIIIVRQGKLQYHRLFSYVHPNFVVCAAVLGGHKNQRLKNNNKQYNIYDVQSRLRFHPVIPNSSY